MYRATSWILDRKATFHGPRVNISIEKNLSTYTVATFNWYLEWWTGFILCVKILPGNGRHLLVICFDFLFKKSDCRRTRRSGPKEPCQPSPLKDALYAVKTKNVSPKYLAVKDFGPKGKQEYHKFKKLNSSCDWNMCLLVMMHAAWWYLSDQVRSWEILDLAEECCCRHCSCVYRSIEIGMSDVNKILNIQGIILTILHEYIPLKVYENPIEILFLSIINGIPVQMYLFFCFWDNVGARSQKKIGRIHELGEGRGVNPTYGHWPWSGRYCVSFVVKRYHV